MTTTMKQYIDEQIAAYEGIRASFPKGDAAYNFLDFDLLNTVRETLTVLYDVKSEIKRAASWEEIKAALREVRSWYEEDLQKAVLDLDKKIAQSHLGVMVKIGLRLEQIARAEYLD